ncbi:MAG: glutamyl-tRNA reductase [Chlamydiae bacterium]|nr:glutamyl-tRNA reductase [Chlamydiota bacterium]
MQVAEGHWNLSDFSYVLLSTCNRTEIYFSAEDLTLAHTRLIALLRSEVGFDFEHCLYSYFGEECFTHLAKVTCGLDSVLFGEAEIQGQVKRAYESACHGQKLPSCMHFLFQKVLKIGKRIRSDYQLPRNKVTLEGVVYDVLKAFFPSSKTPKVLFLGNSEINRMVIKYLNTKGIKDLSLATRAEVLAKPIVQKYDLQLLAWRYIEQWVNYDVVICGTNQTNHLLTRDQVSLFSEPATLIPTSLIIDLSMPRSVDPALAKHPQISLFNIEEINHFANQKQKITILEKERMKGFLQSLIAMQIFCYHKKKNKAQESGLYSQVW